MNVKTEHVHIKYGLTFTSAFHFGTGLRGGLVHRLVARDADGFLYVPGSTLKGVLRERCEQLAQLFNLQTTSPHTEDWREANRRDPDIMTRIFGSRFTPGQLYFDDAQMSESSRALFEVDKNREHLKSKFKAWQVERRTQVSLSRTTRTAQSGLLFTSEYGVRDLQFEGSVLGLLAGFPLDSGEGGVGTYSLLLLLAGLKSLDRLGGSKSSGAGKVECQLTDCCVDGQSISTDGLIKRLEEIEYYWLAREEAAG
ncbi:MAG: RAMP superfamily CRISPR-associated protein [Anaerolineae bacterium]